MVTYQEIVELSKMSKGNYSVAPEALVSFVLDGAIRAYKAGDNTRADEDVVADFDPQTKELRLSKKVAPAATDPDPNQESPAQDLQDNQTESENPIILVPVTDTNTYRAIDAAIGGIRRAIEQSLKNEDNEVIKTKFQELKGHCLAAQVIKGNGNNKDFLVTVAGLEAILPREEQLPNETLSPHQSTTVYVQELRQEANTIEIIVSRIHPSLVSHAMHTHIPEVDLGTIEIKEVARIPGTTSRAAVTSTDVAAVERCQDKETKISQEIGGEAIEFIEWYADTKSFIVSALKKEARDVHLIESAKQALVELFKDESNPISQDSLKLAQDLTGYTIEIKLVDKDADSELPGV